MLHSLCFRRELAILTYHGVIREPMQVPDWCFLEAEDFRRQIAYLRRHVCVLGLREAVDKLAAGTLSRPTVALTFDDGYQNNYDIAFPILQEFDCPATIFLATKYIDTADSPWFCRLSAALGTTKKSSLIWKGASYDLSSPARKANASDLLHADLKQQHPYVIDRLTAEICQQLESDVTISPASPFRMLSSDAIAVMHRSGLVEFGGHTHSHAILSRLSPEEQTSEVLSSLKIVGELTGKPCHTFAYPNGSRTDYQSFTLGLLERSGVQLAASSIEGPNTREVPRLQLRRYSVGSSLTPAEFEATAHHVYHRMRRYCGRAAEESPVAAVAAGHAAEARLA